LALLSVAGLGNRPHRRRQALHKVQKALPPILRAAKRGIINPLGKAPFTFTLITVEAKSLEF